MWAAKCENLVGGADFIGWQTRCNVSEEHRKGWSVLHVVKEQSRIPHKLLD